MIDAVMIFLFAATVGCGNDHAQYLPVGELETQGAILAVAFSPEGRYLAAAASLDTDGWDLLYQNYPGYDPDDRGMVTVWDVRTKQQTAKLAIEDDLRPTDVEYSPDGESVIIACGRCQVPNPSHYLQSDASYVRRGKILLCDPNTLELQREIDLEWSAYDVAISANGTRLAAIGAGLREIVIATWDYDTLGELVNYRSDGRPASIPGIGPIRPLVFSADSRVVIGATVSNGESSRVRDKTPGKVVAVNVETGEVTNEFIFGAGPVTYLDLSADDTELMVVAGEGPRICNFSIAGNLVQHDVRQYIGEAVQFSDADAARLYCCYQFDRKYSGAAAALFVPPAAPSNRKDLLGVFIKSGNHERGWNYSFDIDDDESMIAVGDANGVITMWELPSVESSR